MVRVTYKLSWGRTVTIDLTWIMVLVLLAGLFGKLDVHFEPLEVYFLKCTVTEPFLRYLSCLSTSNPVQLSVQYSCSHVSRRYVGSYPTIE